MKNYFEDFYKRYEALKSDLELKDIKTLNSKVIKSILINESKDASDSKNSQTLNNLVMAGLGMGTLYLRMGAVLMIAEKTKQRAESDVSFLKVIAEKLIHKLPADGEWKDIWKAYLTKDNKSEWNKIVNATPSIPNSNGKIYESFVTFRNNIVHQEIIIKSELTDSEIDKIVTGLKILDAMSLFQERFQNSIITSDNNEVYFQYKPNEEKLKISPYVQINKANEPDSIGILPYLFQGRYYKGAKFINTEGAETNEKKDDSVDETFEQIKSDIARFNGDKAFDFNDKIKNYNEWCIGRDDEVNAILNWINNLETDKKVLPIYAPAGLGKGALVAEVIKHLKILDINHLFHFCGSGPANNLQGILYHLIIQGNKYEYEDKKKNKQKKDIWNKNAFSQKVQGRIDRLPTQYVDVIELFQTLLKGPELELYSKNKPIINENSKLVIIIDGLDEAAVADQTKRISDWFYTYNEKGERAPKWESPKNIKWIFTYRHSSEKDKKGYQFESNEFNTFPLEIVQPLKGLSAEAVKNGLQKEFEKIEPALTDDFLETIIKKGAVK